MLRFLAVLFVALALAPVTASAAAVDTRPNIVFIMTDDQTAESLRVMRNVRGLIGDHGTTFTQMLTSFPLCCPSRSTYLTGQYAHNHGVVQNVGPFGGYARLDGTNTLPLWLQRAGYTTIHVGRYLNGYGIQNTDLSEIPPGWNDWVSTIDPSTWTFNKWKMNENGQILNLPGPDNPTEYQTDYLGRRAAEEIARIGPAPGPFFLSLTTPAPHNGPPTDPGDPPGFKTPSPNPRYRHTFDGVKFPRNPAYDEKNVSDKPRIVARRKRLTSAKKRAIDIHYQQELEALQSVDDAVGTVVRALQKNGELKNTLIVFTSDNGYFHGEHRIPAEKVYPYDPSARVPMVMRGPGVPGGNVDHRLVANIDWAPTIVDAARARPSRLMDGTSLLDLLRDPTRRSGREIVLENGFGVKSLPRYRALRNDRYLWVQHTTTGEVELYDHSRDPYETNNVAGAKAYKRVRILMTRRLRALDRCAGARACGASRPNLRLEAACNAKSVPHYSLKGSERKRVARVRYVRHEGKVRALVRMIDGRVATFDHALPKCVF